MNSISGFGSNVNLGSTMKKRQVIESIKEQLEEHYEENFTALMPDNTIQQREYTTGFNADFNKAFDANKGSYVRLIDSTHVLRDKEIAVNILGFYSKSGCELSVKFLKYVIRGGEKAKKTFTEQVVIDPGQFVYAVRGEYILESGMVSLNSGSCKVVGIKYNNCNPITGFPHQNPVKMIPIGVDLEPTDDDIKETMHTFFVELRKRTKLSYADIAEQLVSALNLPRANLQDDSKRSFHMG